MDKFLSIAILTLFLISMIPPITLHASPITPNATRTIDGDPSDWTGTPPATNNTWTYDDTAGEWIWKDALNDINSYNGAYGAFVNASDIVEFRISGDADYLYILTVFKDMSGMHIGDNGATFLAITIDRDRATGSGETYFSGNSETQTDTDAAWEYQVVVNLADSRYSGNGLTYIQHPLNESTNNWGAIFQLLDSSWNHIYSSGDTGSAGLLAVNISENTIEIKINWSYIGGKPDNEFIRFEVMTANAWSDYANNGGGTWDTDIDSDAVDAMTTTDTITEVSDGVINYYVDVWFVNGEPETPPTVLTITDPTYREWYAYEVGETLKIYAKLEHALNPIADQNVTLLINGTEVAWALTDDNGWANITWTITSDYAGSIINVTVYHPGNATSGTNPASDTRFFLVMSKSIDADASDWSTTLPAYDDTFVFDDSMHEVIWKDSEGDGRGINFTDKTVIDTSNDTTDIIEFHVTSDGVFLYFLVKFKDMSSVKIGENYNPALWIAIAKDRTSDNAWLCDWTNVDVDGAWDYQIRISLADPEYRGSGLTYIRDTLRWEYNYHAVLYKMLDHSYNPWTVRDNWYNTTWVAISTTNSIIEIAVPWMALGGRPGAGENITLYVATALMNSTAKDKADTVPTGYGAAKLLDVVSNLATKDEFASGDSFLNYSLTIVFDANGYPTHGSSYSAVLKVNGGDTATVALGETYTLELTIVDNLGLPVTGASFTLDENGTAIGTYHTDGLGKAVIQLVKTSPSDAGQTFAYTALSITHSNYPSGSSNTVYVHVSGIASRLNLTWRLASDADGDGVPDVGDTIDFIVSVEYYDPVTTSWKPLPNVDVDFSLSIARNGVSDTYTGTTNASGIVVWSYTIPSITAADNLTLVASYAGNSSISGSSDSTWMLVNLYRIIDGSKSDWRTDAPADVPGIGNYGEEIVITDPSGDLHDAASTDPYISDLDIKTVRFTADGEFLYVFIEFYNLERKGDLYIAVAIDSTPSDPGDGQDTWLWLNGYTDTRIGGFDSTGNHIDWKWTHIIEFNINRGLIVRSTANPGGVNYTIVYIAKGITGKAYAVSEANDFVEIRIPLSALPGLDVTSSFKAWIMVFGNYYGGVKYITGSNVVDVAGVGLTGGEVLTLRDPSDWGSPAWPDEDIWVDTSFLLKFTSDYQADAPVPTAPSPSSVEILWPTDGTTLTRTDTNKYFSVFVKVSGTQGRTVTVSIPSLGLTGTGVVGADDVAIVPFEIPNANVSSVELTSTSDGVSDSVTVNIQTLTPVPTPEPPLLPLLLLAVILVLIVIRRRK